jgi:hypothetical protein
MDDWGEQLEEGPIGVRESQRLGWQGWPLKTLSALVILLVSGVGVVVAIALFTQTFPTFTPGQIVSSTCTTLAVQDQGGSWVRFDCPSAAAFTASAGTATATPTGFAGYDALYIVQGTPTTSCTAGTSASQPLGPGSTAVTFGGTGNPPTGNWNYCADFSNFAPKPTFTVAWTQ